MNGHGGNLREFAARLECQPEEILDFSSNINPQGPPSCLHAVILQHIPNLVQYPDPDCTALTDAIAATSGIEESRILVGNGTSDLLFQVPAAVRPKRAVIPVPAYIDYEQACLRADIPIQYILLSAADSFVLDTRYLQEILQPGDLVILGQPNNPTGQLVDSEQLGCLIKAHPDCTFLIDEAFAGFVDSYTSVAGKYPNCITLCSLTKIFAIPGLRLGFLDADPGLCQQLKHCFAPWAVNSLAQSAGVACLADREYLTETRRLVSREYHRLYKQLGALSDVHVYPSVANFLLFRLDAQGHSGSELAEKLLLANRIAIRTCSNYRNLDDRYCRIAVRTATENNRLVQALGQILAPPPKQRPAGHVKKKPALMFLGTGSDVGKSIIVAGLGRILLQDGLRVAPFKAQNMSLNSYVTRNGQEMGRAQVVQAQACRLDPDVRMNPVLLKPSSDVGSQVIVNGQPVGNMKVSEYVQYKGTVWEKVCCAYDSLAEEFDVLLLEGAGSSGEVNLKRHDIVNTKMARYAEARAVLIGDIDRGGVYASFFGHVAVMEPWERDLLAGFLVNRFRGDISLLDEAHEYIHSHTGKPVLGVIPYIANLGLPQEDSVSFKAGCFTAAVPAEPHVEVVMIDLPHISNFTDIEPFLEEPDVYLRIVSRREELGRPDAILLPGSKNVPADMAFLHASGLGEAIVALSSSREVVGICGGFQMLGHRISDPHGLEGLSGKVYEGLGLLEMETALAAKKTLIRKNGAHMPSSEPVWGYEIHHGLTNSGVEPVFSFDDGSSCGMSRGELIWGSYLHGLFDADTFRRWWINTLRCRKALEPYSGPGAVYDLEPAFDRLADVIRKNIDMNALYRLLDL